MQTDFSLAQLADPDTAASEKILRACVHCGFCNATCPTYVLLGDELDSPRGRIYLIKDMLEKERPVGRRDGHAYRPLSLLPRLHDDLPLGRQLHASGRSWPAPYRGSITAAPLPSGCCAICSAWCCRARRCSARRLHGARLARPFAGLLPKRLRPLVALAPRRDPGRRRDGPAAGLPGRGRAADARRAVARLRAAGAGARDQRGDDPAADAPWLRGRRCAGAAAAAARSSTIWARRRRRSPWPAPISTPGRAFARRGGLDAIVVNASGCGTMVKDYGFLLRDGPGLCREGGADLRRWRAT